MVKVDCFKIDGYNLEENCIDIRIASNSFIAQTLSLYFKRVSDQRKLELFSDILKDDRRMLPYKDKLSFFFLNREFESMVDEKDASAIPIEAMKEYFKNLNVFDPDTLGKIGESCDREEWFTLMNRIMREQNKEDDILYKIFKKYSQECDEEKYMFADNLAEFLKHHQNETLENAQASRLLRSHLDQEKLHLRDPNFPLCWDYEEFTGYLCSEVNNMIDPIDDKVHRDMTQPSITR